MEHFVVDVNHSNSYQTWAGLGKPANPTATQWTTIANAAQLAHYDSVATVTITGGTYTKTFTQNYYSVGLIQLTRPVTPVVPIIKTSGLIKPSAYQKGNTVCLTMSPAKEYSVRLYSANGQKVIDRKITAKGTMVLSLADLTAGVYTLECIGLSQKLVKRVVAGR